MALTVKRKNRDLPGPSAASPRPGKNPSIHLDPKQLEVFGRLRMTRHQIAAYYGVSDGVIQYQMNKPEIRNAYDRGMAQTIIGVRQKQLTVALGQSEQRNGAGEVISPAIPPNADMLKYVGRHMADQTDRVEVSEVAAVAGVSWGDAAREKAGEIMARLTSASVSGGNATEASAGE